MQRQREGGASDQFWAQRVRDAGLAPIMVVLLEMIKPVGILCGEMLEAFAVLGGSRMSALGRLCREPEEISAIQAAIMGEMPQGEERLGDA